MRDDTAATKQRAHSLTEGPGPVFLVLPNGLRIEETNDGRTITGHLDAQSGPLRKADMALRAPPGIPPKNVPYGGEGKPVWGGRFTCWGVDLVLDGSCEGTLEWESGK